MYRADALKSLVHFNEALSLAEDYELWTRLVIAGVQMANLQESLVMYRLHEGQASSRGSEKLDETSAKLRSLYCAALLGDESLTKELQAPKFAMATLQKAARLVQVFVASNAGFTNADFRFMLAWIFARNTVLSLQAWWAWRTIQMDLNLALDSNYRFNVFLLALLPGGLKHRYLGTLTKLKR
jgi:hypothetical protein